MSSGKFAAKPLVSVAMTTYNGENYLRKQLDSVFSQTYGNIEVIVSDDCSIDNTVGILEEYKTKHGLRYIVNERNIGFVKNFEKAISLCSGDYIALADQDDIWLPEKIEVLVKEIGDYSLVYSDAFLVDKNDVCLPGSLIEISGVKPVSGNCFEYFVCNNCVTGCTAMFRKELLEIALPIPDVETYHDWWLAVAASRRNGVVFHEGKLTQYRQHGNNYTGACVKVGLPVLISAFRRGETAVQKRDYYELLAGRAHHYLGMGERLKLTVEERSYLEDIAKYAESLLSGSHRITAFRLAIKYKEFLFPAAHGVEKFLFIFSKLFVRHTKSIFQ